MHSLCIVINFLNPQETTQLQRKATWEKGPSAEPKPVIHALSQSFSHTNYEICHTPSSHGALWDKGAWPICCRSWV